MSDEQTPTTADPVEPFADAQQVEEITILSLSGSRRVLIPGMNEYRDIGLGGSEIAALVIDSRDPAFSYMREWAERTPDAAIHGVKEGARVCPICSVAIGSPAELADHVDEVHVDSGEEEETGRPRRRASPRTEAERTERRERIRRATGEG